MTVLGLTSNQPLPRYKDGELITEATNKKFLLVRQEGNHQEKRSIDHYNLDMIIALGYRVQSQVATRFRVSR